jgi:hypothetical protein
MSPLANFRKALLLVHRWLVRRWRGAIAALFTGLALNVLAQDGLKPFLVVLGAIVGCVVVLGAEGWLIGSQVLRHSRREAAAIEAGEHPAKELNR